GDPRQGRGQLPLQGLERVGPLGKRHNGLLGGRRGAGRHRSLIAQALSPKHQPGSDKEQHDPKPHGSRISLGAVPARAEPGQPLFPHLGLYVRHQPAPAACTDCHRSHTIVTGSSKPPRASPPTSFRTWSSMSASSSGPASGALSLTSTSLTPPGPAVSST